MTNWKEAPAQLAIAYADRINPSFKADSERRDRPSDAEKFTRSPDARAAAFPCLEIDSKLGFQKFSLDDGQTWVSTSR